MVHILTSSFYFDVVSNHWGKILYHITTEHFVSVSYKGKVVTIVYDGKSTLKLTCQTCDKAIKLVDALQLEPAETPPTPREVYATTKVLTQLNLEPDEVTKINSELTTLITKLLNKIDNSVAFNPCFSDILSCVYRIRFPRGDINKNISSLKSELYLYFLLLFVNSLERASQLKSSRDYLIRIVGNLGNTISIIADDLRINVKHLLGACNLYCEGGSVAGIYNESKKLQVTVMEKFADERKDLEIKDFTLIDKIFSIAVMVICGGLAGVYQFSIDTLTKEIVEYVCSIRSGRITETSKLDLQMKIFAGDMLRCCNETRYEPEFQYVFAIWVLIGEPIN
ncbi:hypothetical protein GPJ56_001065 [Histomonas meleagridis]|uniref:uncharacterized protein n=1 Tax=Histomonas meleagridis TaxID=135588 RepID=UPI0035593765|nr:hypothetical protein GPJ56_001065 [Histomonas meleagridis]KAH0804854.1 hypothetical protein GO595_002368 [Histomonas meleagridis]